MPRIRTTVNLTVSACNSATYEGTGKSKTIVWDSGVPGLGLRVYPTGKKAWVVEYRTETNKRRLYTLRGQFPSVSPHAARKAAQEYLGQVAAGTDLVAEREEAKAQEAKATTVKEIVETYKEKYLVTLKTEANLRRVLERDVLPTFAKRDPETLTTKEVTDWHLEIAKNSGDASAGKAYNTLRAMLRWAQEQEIITSSWTFPRIARGKKRTHGTRETYVPEDKLGQVFPALDRYRSAGATILKLVLLTGARPIEWRTARREWVDLDQGVMVIPPEHHKTGGKTGKSRRIPLCDEAIEIVRGLPRRLDTTLLFPSPRDAQKPLSHESVWKVWNRVRRDLDLGHVTVYDLRRTAATMLLAAGIDHLTIARVLGHAGLGQVQTYARIVARKEAEAVNVLGSLMKGGSSA